MKSWLSTFSTGGLASGLTGGLVLAGSPWWAVAFLALIGLVLTCGVTLLLALMPQDSSDRRQVLLIVVQRIGRTATHADRELSQHIGGSSHE
jgi:hypothetical protein